MSRRRTASLWVMSIAVLAVTALAAGCTPVGQATFIPPTVLLPPTIVPTATPVPEQPTSAPGPSDTGGMTMEEAKAIAATGDCGAVGPQTEQDFFNPNSGTWWIGLQSSKEGCSPACVVSAATKAADVNWRCTGAVPPEQGGGTGTTAPSRTP